MNKREFLRTMGGVSAGLVFGPELLAQYESVPAAQLAEDEPFWAAIRTKFKLNPDYINLENGYYCFQSEEVLEGFIGHVRHVNYLGSRYMRTVKDEDKLRVRTRLAALAGCSPAELIITRNTTESLDTVIAGFDWKPGDEAVIDVGAHVTSICVHDRGMTRFVFFSRYLPVVPVIGDGRTRVDPVAVQDVARCVAEAVRREDAKDKALDLGGPERLTMDEIIRTVAYPLDELLDMIAGGEITDALTILSLQRAWFYLRPGG